MSRVLRVALAAAAVALPTIAAASEATTTRIETRAFYGATVTLEAGVRVFRPLPPHSKVIINPDGRTPLHLGIEESRSTNYNYNNDVPGPDGRLGAIEPGYGASYPGYGFAGGKHHYGRHGLGAFPWHVNRHHGPKVPHHTVHTAKPHHGPGPGKH